MTAVRTRPAGAAGALHEGDLRRRAILVVAMAATFMAMMDSYIVNVAIASIRKDLGVSASTAEITVGGYILVYGLFLVTGGRLGDMLGFRRMFLASLGLFTVASPACGTAPDPPRWSYSDVFRASPGPCSSRRSSRSSRPCSRESGE